MVAMLTYEGTCCIAVNFDPEAIADAAADVERQRPPADVRHLPTEVTIIDLLPVSGVRREPRAASGGNSVERPQFPFHLRLLY